MPRKEGAQKGNKSGIKIKEPDIRQEAFKQYLAHIASGYPKESFVFKHPTHSVHWETIDKYIEENPVEFPPNLMQKALSERYNTLYGEGLKLMKGHYKGGSPVVWQTIMRNMFRKERWDQDLKVNDHQQPFNEHCDVLEKRPVVDASNQASKP